MSDDIDIGYNLDSSGYVTGMAQIDQANQAANKSMYALAATAVGLRTQLANLTPGGMKTLGMGVMVKEAADTEQALSGLSATAKVTGVDAVRLSGTMRELARSFPVGVQGSRDLVMAFTRMGVASAGSESQITKLATATAKLSGATGEGIGQLAEGMTGLSRATGNTALDPKRFSDLGDSLTKISASSGASAGSILAFSKNIAPMAQAAGIGATGVLGISSAFARLGEDGVGASTAVNKMLTDMNKAVQDGSPQLQAYSQILGMTTDQFKDFYKASPTQTLGALTSKIANSGPSGIRDLESIGIEGIRGQRAFQALIGSGGLESATKEATAAYGSGITEKASEAAFGGLNDALTELTANARELGDNLGSPLLGPLTAFTKGLSFGTGILAKMAGSEIGQKAVGAVGVVGELAGLIRGVLPVLALLGLGRMALTGGGLKSLFAGMAAGRGDVGLGRDTLLRRQGGRFEEQMVRNSAGIPGLNRGSYAVGERLGEEAMYRQAFTEQRKRSDFFEKNRSRYETMPLTPMGQQMMANQEFNAAQAEREARRAQPLRERVIAGGRTGLAYGSGLFQSYFGTGSEFKRAAAARAEERGRINMLPGFTDQMSTAKLSYGDARAAGAGTIGATREALKSFHEEMRATGKSTGMLRANFSALGESVRATAGLGGALLRDAKTGVGKVAGGAGALVGGIDKGLGVVGGLGGVAAMGLIGLIQAGVQDSQSYKDRLSEFDNSSVSKLMDRYRESAGIATGPTTTFKSVSSNLGQNIVASVSSPEQAREVTDADIAAATGHKIVNQYYGGKEDILAQLKLASPGGMTAQEMQVVKQDLLAQNPSNRQLVSQIMAGVPAQSPTAVPGGLGREAFQAMAGAGNLPDAGWLRNVAPSMKGWGDSDIFHIGTVSEQQSGLIDTTVGGTENRYQSQASTFGSDYAMQERLKTYDEALKGAAEMAKRTGNTDVFQELSDKIARQVTGDTSIRGMGIEEFWNRGGPEGRVNIGQTLAENAEGSQSGQQKAYAAAYRALQSEQNKTGGQLPAITKDSPIYKTILGQSGVIAQSFNPRLGSVESTAVARALQNPASPQALNDATNEMINAAKRAGLSLGDFAVQAGHVASKLAAGTPEFQVATAAAAKADSRFQAELIDMTPAQRAKAVRDQGMKLAATPRDNDFSNARADQGQAMTQQQYAADRERLTQRLQMQWQYDINKGRQTADYTLQRGYAVKDYGITVERTRTQFGVTEERARKDHLLGVQRAEQDYRTSTQRAEQDFTTARLRQQRDFQINSRRSEEDYLTARGRSIRDFNKQMTRQIADAADTMYDPFQRIQTKPTWDAANLAENLKEQAAAMKKQEDQLDQLRKAGLSDTAIESLGLNKAENAQQVNNLATDALTDPNSVKAINDSTEARRKAGEALYQDPNNKDLKRQKEDFATSLADMSKDHLKAVKRSKEDFNKVEADQLADFRRSMDRVHSDFLRQMARGEVDYNTQMTRAETDLEVTLGHMADDQERALTRMDTAFGTSMTRMAEDIKNADLVISGDMETLTKETNKAMHGQAVAWGKLLVKDSQTLVDDLTTKVVPKYRDVATQLGINLGESLNPTGITGPSHNKSGANQKLANSALAEGGSVPGFSAHPKADNIPIMATAGEFMQPVAAVQHYGTDAMEAIQQKRVPKEVLMGYANGGLIAPVNVKPEFPWGHYPSGGWHPALDYAVRIGTPVRAPMTGTVVVDGWDRGGFGTHVRLQNYDNTFTILGHLSSELVRIGQHIQAGQIIGLSGSTGNSTGPHVHEEMRRRLWEKSTAFDFTHGTSGYGIKGVGPGLGFGTPGMDSKDIFAGLDQKRGNWYGRMRNDLKRRFDAAQAEYGFVNDTTSVVDRISGDTGAHGTRAERNQAIARALLGRYGFSGAQMPALIQLWNGESGWNELAKNPSSGAYGIPQSLPGSKMGSIAGDWRANPETQIRWGLQYIKGRYGTPEAAWRKWNQRSPHWYDEGGMMAPGAGVHVNATGKPEAVLTKIQWTEISALAKLAGAMLSSDDLRGMHASRGAHITINNSGSVTYDQRNDFGGAHIIIQAEDPNRLGRLIEAKAIAGRITQTRGVRRSA